MCLKSVAGNACNTCQLHYKKSIIGSFSIKLIHLHIIPSNFEFEGLKSFSYVLHYLIEKYRKVESEKKHPTLKVK